MDISVKLSAEYKELNLRETPKIEKNIFKTLSLINIKK
jgi:hypothetical protein